MEYNVDNIFTYHKPIRESTKRYEEILEFGRRMAVTILQCAPESAERTLALRKIEEAVMWANASIARNENAV